MAPRLYRDALRRADLRLVAFLVAGALVAWAVALIVADLGFARIQAFDERVLLLFRRRDNPAIPIGPPWLPSAAHWITLLGGLRVLLIVSAGAAGYLLLKRHYGMLLLAIASTIVGTWIVEPLKHFFGRPRPTIVPHLIPVASLSFPSGHALRSALFYMTLATLVAGATPNQATKRYIILAAALVTCAIGLSRVFLGVHYLTDVLGGWAVGLLWALACGIIARKLQRLRCITPEERSSGR